MFPIGPNGKTVPIQKSKLRGLTYTITAEEVGEHVIQILVNGQHIKGSPFRFVEGRKRYFRLEAKSS